jgi:hypothetical protein
MNARAGGRSALPGDGGQGKLGQGRAAPGRIRCLTLLRSPCYRLQVVPHAVFHQESSPGSRGGRADCGPYSKQPLGEGSAG